jgi:hypothetical protein
MASREEEKRRRREEREAQERAEAARAARGKRLQIALATLLGLAIVAAGVFAITQSGGGNDSNAKAPSGNDPKAKIPTGGPTDLKAAAKAAGCELKTAPSEGRGHTDKPVTYKTNPPTSGAHNPVAADDGLYDPGNEPAKEHTVHSLEHGRIEIQYRKGTAPGVVNQLETLGSEPFNGSQGYHVLVFQNQTNMPYAVAATAWTQTLGCKKMTPGFFAAERAFRKAYTDKGPEFIP